MVRMIKKRAKNLSEEDVEVVVSILDGWTGKLSWELFIDAIYERLNVRYTRQALHKQDRIRNAFRLRKKALKDEPEREDGDRPISPAEAKMFRDRCARLEAENVRLKEENRRFYEQFVVWAYNARGKGCDIDCLNRPLPNVNRGRTD